MSKARKRRKLSPGISLSDEHRLLFEKVKTRGTQATCFFNNKGGVGKTTLVANLGAELATNFSAKVLVVDADPQCNLTQYVLGEAEAIEIYENTDPASVYSVIRPLSLGKGYGTSLPVRKSEGFGFDIIVGDPRLALQEDLLANDWRDAKGGGMRGIRTTYVFADLVAKAKSMNYDFVFFDMGPSLGAINRSVLLAMDYFVVPMSIDIFSTWAIKNIGSTVAIWQKELKNGVSLAEDPSEIPSIDQFRRLGFLGYVTQQHRERTEETIAAEDAELMDDLQDDEDSTEELRGEAYAKRRRRIVQAYEEISHSFPNQIATHLAPFFNSSKMDPHLGNIKNLGSIAPKSQTQHLPMISVRGTGRFVQSRKEAREIYRKVASRFLENLSISQQ